MNELVSLRICTTKCFRNVDLEKRGKKVRYFLFILFFSSTFSISFSPMDPVQQFIDITGAPLDTATYFLDLADFHLDNAIQLYYDEGDQRMNGGYVPATNYGSSENRDDPQNRTEDNRDDSMRYVHVPL